MLVTEIGLFRLSSCLLSSLHWRISHWLSSRPPCLRVHHRPIRNDCWRLHCCHKALSPSALDCLGAVGPRAWIDQLHDGVHPPSSIHRLPDPHGSCNRDYLLCDILSCPCSSFSSRKCSSSLVLRLYPNVCTGKAYLSSSTAHASDPNL